MDLKNYKIIKTEDGSETLFSVTFNEACHSIAGAAAETRLHYIDGCKIVERSDQLDQLNILEVGFGTGLGLAETKNALPHKKVHFTSFELDEELVEYSLKKLNIPYQKKNHDFYGQWDQLVLEILVGNARERVKDLINQYHAIYQDAFSPRRNAILWTKEWFEDLKMFADPTCLMSTYSASSSIRKSMIEAGWKVYAGVKFGPKRTSTRARLTGVTDEAIVKQLERSPAIVLQDNNYQEYQNEKNKS